MVGHRVSVLHPGVQPLRTQLCPVLDFISEVLHSCRVYDQAVTCWKAYSVLKFYLKISKYFENTFLKKFSQFLTKQQRKSKLQLLIW